MTAIAPLYRVVPDDLRGESYAQTDEFSSMMLSPAYARSLAAIARAAGENARALTRVDLLSTTAAPLSSPFEDNEDLHLSAPVWYLQVAQRINWRLGGFDLAIGGSHVPTTREVCRCVARLLRAPGPDAFEAAWRIGGGSTVARLTDWALARRVDPAYAHRLGEVSKPWRARLAAEVVHREDGLTTVTWQEEPLA